jgi:hypothetical protein
MKIFVFIFLRPFPDLRRVHTRGFSASFWPKDEKTSRNASRIFKKFVFSLFFSAPKILEISKLFGAEIDGKPKVKSRKLNNQSQRSIFDAQIIFDIRAASAMPNLSAVILFRHSFLIFTVNGRRRNRNFFGFRFSFFVFRLAEKTIV